MASYLADVAKKTCSDQDMMDILNSVIFIDSVKFPTLVSLAYFSHDGL